MGVRSGWLSISLFGLALTGLGSPVALHAAPPAAASAPAHSKRALQAQVRQVGAKIATERARNGDLQAKVSALEAQNAASAKALQDRDAQIAALQRQLDAHGAPASAGH